MRALTLEHVAEVLLEHDLITQDHLRTIMVRENQLVAMARKAKERIWGKDSRPGAALVTPVGNRGAGANSTPGRLSW